MADRNLVRDRAGLARYAPAGDYRSRFTGVRRWLEPSRTGGGDPADVLDRNWDDQASDRSNAGDVR